MKIAFNPSTVEALIAPPNNKDITFDLRGQNIFARGVKFCGTDTNTWRDIKINNVSIDSNTLDLRDGSNTTLTNINGVVTINSTWRPVVDNLTSDSTTSSLSANLGRVLKALIDGKSDSDHNHDDRYLRLTGGTMQLGEGLKFHADENYFGTDLDARIISLLDLNDKICDGGLIIDERGILDGKEYVTELLRIRDSEFKWRGNNILHSGNTYVNNNKGYINNTEITLVNNSDTVDGYHASSLVKFYLSPMTSNAPADSAKSWFVNNLPSASGAIVYNVPGSEKTIIAGKSSGAHGHMLQLNYDDNYLRILRYFSGSWKTTNWEKISAGYADSAGSVAWDNVTGKPSSYIPSAHTHSWTSITDKLVAGNEFNIVNAGFNNRIWFNYLPINDRSKIATIAGYNFGNGAQGYATVTASGFVKTGSSSSYVLLGDGDHKTISSLSVNYASSAGNADTLDGNHASAFAAVSHTHPYLPLSGAYITGTNIADMKVNIRNYFNGKPAGTNCYVGSPNIIYNFLNDSAACDANSVCGIMALNPGYDNYNHGHFLVSHYGDNRIGMIGLGYLTWYGPNWFAYTSDIPTVTDYYWANIKVSASSSTSTSPTFESLWINNSHFFKLSGTTFTCQGGTTFTLPSSSLNTNTALLWTTASDGTRDTGIFYNSSDFAFIANSNDHGAVFAVYDTDVTQDFEAGAREISVPGSGGALWARGGFSKNGSSNDYVLLGGGGHKALSDFSISGHTHSSITIPVCSSLDENSDVFRIEYAGGSNSVATKPSGVDAFGVIRLRTAAGWYGQIMMSADTAPGIYYRNANGLSSSVGWKKLLDSSNFNSYSPKLDGTGASGTWNISITGNADTIDNIHSTGFLRWKGMLNIGNNAPFQAVVDIIKDTSKLNDGGLAFYSYAGDEYTVLIGSRNDATRHGNALKWGYANKYLWMIRMTNGSPKSSDWEKISAGYADSSGNTDLLDGYHASSLFTNLSNSGNNISITIGGTNKTLTVDYASTATLVSKSLKWTDATGTVLSYNGGTEKSITSLNFPCNQIALNFRHPGDGYATKILYMTAGNEALVFAAQNSVTSFIFKSGANITNSNLWYDQVPTPTLQLKGLSAYINKLIANGSVPAFNFLVNGSSRFDGKLWQLYSTRTDPNATCIRDSAIACFGEYDDDAMWIGNNTNNGTWILVSFKGDEDRPSKNYLYNLSLLPLGGNVGIGTNSPTEKLTVNGWIGTNGIYTNRTGSSTDGGVSLYSNVDPMTYGIAFRGTGTYGTHGYVTSTGDWATYLTMNDSTTRGWIFRRGDTNVASIAGSGNMAIGLHLEFSNGAHISTNRSTDYHYGYTFNLGDNAKSIGMYSGPVGEAGGVVISPDGCLIYNSSDCGYNLQVRDKDLGSDLTNITTLTFGIELSGYYAWSRGGFKKNGSSDSYVLLGGGGHSKITDLSVANAYHLYINSANTWSNWYWAGLGGLPSWLWGSNDGTNMYVWDPNNFNVYTALYLRSLGNLNCQTGRTLNYGDVYSYNTIHSNTGAPTDYTSVIGFGRGIEGTVEIAGGWCNTGLYWRSLRDCCEDWYSWRTVLDSSNYTGFINNYYWANVKISTSSSTTTSPTVSDLTATSSIKMGNILLEYTDEINNSTNGYLHLNYRSSGNISLCQGGGNVGIGTTSPAYKLDVNGLMRANGFHHESANSDNYILLAGGGYKSFGGDYDNPIFLGYLNLDHGNDGTISSSFYCLGYSVPFTYTRGGNYCKISIPDTSYQVFYIKAAIASVNYSGGGMDTWTGNRRGDGSWWLHCYASGSNEVRVKGFRQKDTNNDSWWGGNPLIPDSGGANRITVCIFGYVTFR